MAAVKPFQFFDEESFHFETLRAVALAPFGGSDIGEILSVIPKIKENDFESWSNEWASLARKVERQAHVSDPSTRSGRVSRRQTLFKAASYWRSADFYNHGNKDDSRVDAFWENQERCFDEALSLLDEPVKRFEIDTPHGFKVAAIYIRSPYGEGKPAPTLLVGNGYDGAMEEMYHIVGLACWERGFNVLLHEGPGQPSVRRWQGNGFVAEWEETVTPCVDWLEKNAAELGVDVERLGLWGQSLGGSLALRAVAFEPRIAAVILCDGVWAPQVPPVLQQENEEIKAFVAQANAPAGARWIATHGLWAMLDQGEAYDESGEPRYDEYRRRFEAFSVESFIDKIRCKVFVLDAPGDIFFKGQPEKVYKALGPEKATYRLFTDEEGAGAHCQLGAGILLMQETMDWFEKAVGSAYILSVKEQVCDCDRAMATQN